MSKYSLLIASCFLFGTQLCADPIQTLTITSLTASQDAPFNGPVQFTASGPSVTISGSQGKVSPFERLPVGTPIGPVFIVLPPEGNIPNLMLAGLLTTTTPETALQLQAKPDPLSGPLISGTTSLRVPANGHVTFPGTVKGEYAAFACGIFESPPRCTGPQIANIPIDLPGLITLSFSGPGPLGNAQLDTASFTTIPEPYSVFLSLLGGAILAGALIARRRKSSNWISASR